MYIISQLSNCSSISRRNVSISRINYSDFHTHSTCSDGGNNPEILANLYEKAGLEFASLTDHNTIAGTSDAKRQSRKFGIEFFPGIELSCKDRIHVLGIGLNTKNSALEKACADQELIHRNRAVRQVAILEENNFKIDRSVLRKEKGIITEHEIFRATENNGGVFRDFAKKWLYKKSPYYVKIERMTVGEAINLIHDAGGIAVWAHPGHTFKKNLAGIADRVSEFKILGLDGIEVFSSKHTLEQATLLRSLSQKFALVMSAGSDYHGLNNRKLGEYNTFGLKFDEQQLINLLNK